METDSLATIWWVATGVLVAAELLSGTFYLLMLALGAFAGAAAFHLGLALPAQIVAAAVVGAGATVLWHWRRRATGRRESDAAAHANRDVILDIGEPVHVEAWAADRTARVSYRGSTWAARLASGAHASPGRHRVASIEGNWLVLTPAPLT